MQGSYNLWLVASSYLVAVVASYTALELAGRVVASKGRSTWVWLGGGSVALGLGVWSMHFVAMLAFHLPIRFAYNLPVTLLSVQPAILSAALVLELVRRGDLQGWRMALAAVVLGCGIAAMHYSGMAAIDISPRIGYQPFLLLASIAVAIAVAYVALRLAFSLSEEASWRKKGAAALVMGSAIAAMHYTGMAAARFAPDSICTVTPSTIDSTLLGGIIGFNTVIILMATVAIAAYDARFASANARMVTALQAANEELAGYYATMEEERRIAKHLIDRLNRASQAPAVQVAHKILPARYFSGDLVAVARTPSDTVHVLLADSTGHGLSAALGVLPVVQPFYAMSTKGFSIGSIAREMNAKVAAMLPTGRFVAAAIASIDPWMGVVSVWNGGMPACHVIDGAGHSVRRFASRQPPLGVLDDAELDAGLESFHFDHDCQLIMTSDGLVDAENADGKAFEEERLLEVLGNALPSVRLRTLSAAVHGHIGYDQPDDDISIVVAECRRTLVPAAAPIWEGGVAGASRVDGTRLQFALSAEEIRRADVVPALCNALGELGVGSGNTAKIFIVLSELYNNAVDHGLLELESSLKSGADGFDSYGAVRRERLQQLQHGSIEIEVQCIAREGRPFLKIRVRDSGRGFAYQPYLTIPLDKLGGTELHGRGIGLLRSSCAAVDYNDAGREAEVYLPLVAAEV